MFSQPPPPFKETSLLIPFHITADFLQVEIPLYFTKALIIKITSLQNEKETQRIRVLSTICYKRYILHILRGLAIMEMIAGKP